MPNALSKLTKHLMGDRTPPIAGVETEYPEESALRRKIGYLSMMELFRDFTPDQMEEVVRATKMQTCKPGRIFIRRGRQERSSSS